MEKVLRNPYPLPRNNFNLWTRFTKCLRSNLHFKSLAPPCIYAPMAVCQ